MPILSQFLIFLMLLFSTHVAAMTCFRGGIDPRIDPHDCISAWAKIFMPILRRGPPSDWDRNQPFTKGPSGLISARKSGIHGSCIVSLGVLGHAPVVHTSWHFLSKGVLEVMDVCVKPSQRGFGGRHEEGEIEWVITHFDAYDMLRGKWKEAH